MMALTVKLATLVKNVAAWVYGVAVWLDDLTGVVSPGPSWPALANPSTKP